MVDRVSTAGAIGVITAADLVPAARRPGGPAGLYPSRRLGFGRSAASVTAV
jgi:hypothetical protein